MDKVTSRVLELKVEYLSRRLHTDFRLDSYNPDGRRRLYRLVEIRYISSEHDVHTNRYEAAQMLAYLNGMIDCIDGYATAGV